MSVAEIEGLEIGHDAPSGLWSEARYRLIQFTGPPTLPESLNRYLQINDAVLRHRLIHTPGGEPPPAPAPPSAPPAAAEAQAAAPAPAAAPTE